MTAPVPEPAGVEKLPHDQRGIPIPAHVGRPDNGPIRIAELDPHRLFLLTAARRCTICAWAIPDDERCWYFSWPPAIEKNRQLRWKAWDQAVEGAGHLECMLYSAVACPFLSSPDYQRRTPQRRSDAVVAPKGTPRGEMVLAGALEVRLRMQRTTFDVVLGGGPMEVRPFTNGTELLPDLLAELKRWRREPTSEDLEFMAFMVRPDDDAIGLAFRRQTIVTGVREGFPFPAPGRNDRCPCESGTKYKFCCEPRVRWAESHKFHDRQAPPIPRR